MVGNGRKDSRLPASPTRRARCTASVTQNSSTACRLSPITPTWSPDVDNFTNGEISVRFQGLSGRIDQGAGILFNLKPNGDYLTIRANCLENNLVLWKFEKGRRSSVEWVRNTPTPTRQWHDLKVRISGAKIEGYLDGKLYLNHTWSEPISGKIGLWSKADSYMHFDQFAAVPGE
jgi:hypothetical protein